MKIKNTKLNNIFTLIIMLIFVSANANVLISTPPESDQGKSKQSSLTLKHDKEAKVITFSSYNSKFSVEIFDVEGNTLKTEKIKKNKTKTISIKDINSGVYFIRYIGDSEKNNSVKKILIE